MPDKIDYPATVEQESQFLKQNHSQIEQTTNLPHVLAEPIDNGLQQIVSQNQIDGEFEPKSSPIKHSKILEKETQDIIFNIDHQIQAKFKGHKKYNGCRLYKTGEIIVNAINQAKSPNQSLAM